MNRRDFLASLPAIGLGLAALVSKALNTARKQPIQDAHHWPQDRETFLHHLKTTMIDQSGHEPSVGYLVHPDRMRDLMLKKYALETDRAFLHGDGGTKPRGLLHE